MYLFHPAAHPQFKCLLTAHVISSLKTRCFKCLVNKGLNYRNFQFQAKILVTYSFSLFRIFQALGFVGDDSMTVEDLKEERKPIGSALVCLAKALLTLLWLQSRTKVKEQPCEGTYQLQLIVWNGCVYSYRIWWIRSVDCCKVSDKLERSFKL